MKPRLLFISPVLPSPDGPGLAMRPYYQIVNLSQIYSIYLLVAESIPENLSNTAHIETLLRKDGLLIPIPLFRMEIKTMETQLPFNGQSQAFYQRR